MERKTENRRPRELQTQRPSRCCAKSRSSSASTTTQINGLLKDAEGISITARGEAVIEEGTEGDSMFILLRGSAQVSVTKNGALIRVGVLREGDCFGEMSLLTGEPRTATVRAEKDCEVLEISKPVMARAAPDMRRSA